MCKYTYANIKPYMWVSSDCQGQIYSEFCCTFKTILFVTSNHNVMILKRVKFWSWACVSSIKSSVQIRAVKSVKSNLREKATKMCKLHLHLLVNVTHVPLFFYPLGQWLHWSLFACFNLFNRRIEFYFIILSF